MTKLQIEFPSYEGRFRLRGSAFLPDTRDGPLPVIIMTHGMGDAAARIEPFAEHFCDNGFGVILYDHRTFLPSEGGPYQEVDPIAQIRDMQMAITLAESMPEFDSNRIGIWGTSFSGGLVLAVTGMDKRVKVVVSQAPWIDGNVIARHVLGDAGLKAFQAAFNEERHKTLKGLVPGQTLSVRKPGDEGKGFALVTTEEGYDYMLNGPAGIPAGWQNSFTTRSLEYALEFEVNQYAKRLGPTPFMLIVGKQDALIPASMTHAFFDAADTTMKEMVSVDAEHHTLYMPSKGLEPCAEAAARWFKEHL